VFLRRPSGALRLLKGSAADGASGETPRDRSDQSRGGSVSGAESDDADAFEEVYHAHGAAIYGLCLRMAGDSGAARELVQDVFVRAWEQRGSFRGESAYGTWLHRLAVNVVLERFRSDQRRDQRVTAQSDDALAAAPVRHAGPDDELDIATSLARLPAGARTAFVLHHVEGYSYQEIAELSHVAAATIRAQVFQARQLLMRMLS
jgi:RNA polymerase sigma-70 factor (ECF subfamily)